MPTLAARIPTTIADKATSAVAATTSLLLLSSASSSSSSSSSSSEVMATHPATANSSFDITAGGATTPTNSNATTTCTFSTNNDYRQHFPQTTQQNPQLHQPLLPPPPSQFKHHHFYSHQQNHEQKQHLNSSPPLPPSQTQLDETGSGSGCSSVVGAAAAAAATAVDSSSVTFNGNATTSASIAAAAAAASAASEAYIAVVENASVSNGNIAGIVVTNSNGNSNIMSTSFPKAAEAATTPTTTSATIHAPTTNTYNTILANNKLETSSTAGSSSLNGSIKKSSSSSHASREDIASLGGGSSIHSQSTTAMHNISNCSINNNFTKDNCLQNYYNGICDGRDGNDDDDDLGPLPPKWETAYTERGELYFIDHNTGTSHWLDPRLSKFQKKSLEDCCDDELPYGWEKIEDSLYGTYYIDHVNRRTQYENPVLEAKRRAAEQRKHLQPPPPPHVLSHGAAVESGRQPVGGVGCSGADDATSSTLTTVGMDCPPLASIGALQQTTSLPPTSLLPYKFTRNPAEMQGKRITTTLLKSARGLGITIVGGDDAAEEFLQIKSVVPNGPAWMDGKLQTGDILVYVNDLCVLGFTHHEMVNVFQSLLPGDTVTLEVCRGYPLPFDPNDPNTEVVTTIAVDGITSEHTSEKQRRLLLDLNMDGNYNFLDVSDGAGGCDISDAPLKQLASSHASESVGDFILVKKPEVLKFSIAKGLMGFGFTIADSAYGQKVKKILDRNCCKQLQEGDILLEINSLSVRHKSHTEVVQVLKDCSKIAPTTVKIQRGGTSFGSSTGAGASGGGGGAMSNVTKQRKNQGGSNNATSLYRSKTPTADLYSTQPKEILPIRPKTPLVDTRARARVQTPNNELHDAEVAAATNGIGAASEHRALLTTAAAAAASSDHKSTQPDAKSTTSLQELETIQHEIPFMDPYPKLVTSLSERLAEAALVNDTMGGSAHRAQQAPPHFVNNYTNHEHVSVACNASVSAMSAGGYNPIYGMSSMLPATNMTSSSLAPSVQQTTYQPLAHSGALYSPTLHYMTTTAPMPTYHHDSCYCYECQDYRHNIRRYRQQHQQLQPLQTNYYTLQQQQPLYSPLLHAPTTATTAATATTSPLQAAHIQNERMQKRVNELLHDRRQVGFNPLEAPSSVGHGSAGYHMPASQQQQQQSPPAAVITHHQSPHQTTPTNWNYHNMLQPVMVAGGVPQIGGALSSSNGGTLTPIFRQSAEEDEHLQYELSEVTLERQALGFGFRIVGGTEEGSQVTVGHIVPGGAADNDHRIATGDEILSIDGINVVNSSHHKVVSLMGEAALRGQVNMILRRRTLRAYLGGPTMSTTLRYPLSSTRYPYDVIVSRNENEGFGFVIISSSNQYYGSTIGKLIPGSPADRCGELKVGDRIVAVNRIEIAGMSHGDVVQLIKESGLHVRLTIGCPKDGNPLLSASAQASPGSQLPPTQQLSTSPAIASGSLVTAAPPSLLQPSHLTQQQQHQHQQQPQQQLPHSETSTYFERNTQPAQHPQL